MLAATDTLKPSNAAGASVLLPLEILLLVSVLALVGGIIGGLGGPGAVPALLVLYLLTPFSPSQIAGTISATNAFSVAFGVSIFNRSQNVEWRSVPFLVPATFLGTKIGVELNGYLSKEAFGYLLSVLLLFLGAYTIYRELRSFAPIVEIDLRSRRGSVLFLALGLFIGVIGGTTGTSGVPIAILVMVLFGVSPLTAIGTAMVLGVFTSLSTAVNFVLEGSVVYPLVALMAPLFAAGIGIGWYAARRISTGRMRTLIGAMLFFMAFAPLL